MATRKTSKTSRAKSTKGSPKGSQKWLVVLLIIVAIVVVVLSMNSSDSPKSMAPIKQQVEKQMHKGKQTIKDGTQKISKEAKQVARKAKKAAKQAGEVANEVKTDAAKEVEQIKESLETTAKSSDSAKAKSTTVHSTGAIEIPYIKDSTYVIRNNDGRYTLLYSPRDKQPYWVAYRLTGEEASRKEAERKDRFYSDPRVEVNGWASAENSDYSRSGYDRGHLLPSADRDDSDSENGATFLFSNISPQKPALNRGTWSALEKQVRKWAIEHDTLYIVTAGVLAETPRVTIGDNKVTVPDYFYKAIVAKSGAKCSAIAFIMPNRDDVGKNIFGYVESVDALEKRIGVDLFPALDDSTEKAIESKIDLIFWK